MEPFLLQGPRILPGCGTLTLFICRSLATLACSSLCPLLGTWPTSYEAVKKPAFTGFFFKAVSIRTARAFLGCSLAPSKWWAAWWWANRRLSENSKQEEESNPTQRLTATLLELTARALGSLFPVPFLLLLPQTHSRAVYAPHEIASLSLSLCKYQQAIRGDDMMAWVKHLLWSQDFQLLHQALPLTLGKVPMSLCCKIRIFGELNYPQQTILTSVERMLWGSVSCY